MWHAFHRCELCVTRSLSPLKKLCTWLLSPAIVPFLGIQDGAGDEDAPAGEVKEDQEQTDDAQSEGALSADESEEDEEQEADIKNVLVAQFEKVTRSRNKWKCTLKDGVMHIDGREYLFSTAFGEMQF